MWGQHEDNVETTWGPWGCRDHMGTTWGQHGWSQKIIFLDEGAIVTPLIGLVLGGEVPRLNHGPICCPIQNT